MDPDEPPDDLTAELWILVGSDLRERMTTDLDQRVTDWFDRWMGELAAHAVAGRMTQRHVDDALAEALEDAAKKIRAMGGAP